MLGSVLRIARLSQNNRRKWGACWGHLLWLPSTIQCPHCVLVNLQIVCLFEVNCVFKADTVPDTCQDQGGLEMKKTLHSGDTSHIQLIWGPGKHQPWHIMVIYWLPGERWEGGIPCHHGHPPQTYKLSLTICGGRESPLRNSTKLLVESLSTVKKSTQRPWGAVHVMGQDKEMWCLTWSPGIERRQWVGLR